MEDRLATSRGVVEAVNEIANAFKNFIYRDLFYVLSGLIILLSAREVGTIRVDNFLHEGTVLLVLYVGFAYALAIANQELWSQLPFVMTHRQTSYNKWLLSIYKRHNGIPWAKGDDPPGKSVCDDPDYLRAINIKQLGSSLGTALLTSAILLTVAACLGRDGAAGAAGLAFFLGVVFIHLSWLHNMRQSAFKKKPD
jgi:hypothetical protein